MTSASYHCERLRRKQFGYGTTIYVAGAAINPDGEPAASFIEAQAAEIERLRGLLSDADAILADVQRVTQGPTLDRRIAAWRATLSPEAPK